MDVPPTRIIPRGYTDPRKVSAFIKAWKPSRNYTGKPYDILVDKTKHFISVYKRFEIGEDMYHAVFPDILFERAEDFYLNIIGPRKRWDEIYNLLDTHFNTSLNHAEYYLDWTTLTFERVREENPDTPAKEVLKKLIDKLQIVQRALGEGYQGEIALQHRNGRISPLVGQKELADHRRHHHCRRHHCRHHQFLTPLANSTASPTTYRLGPMASLPPVG